MAFWWDSYERKAVVAPAILVLLPYGVLQYYFLDKITGFEHLFDALKILTVIGLPLIFLYFITSTARLIGKEIFEVWFFKDSLFLPTTTFLLYGDKTLSKVQKKAIRAKIESEFSIKLFSEEEEAKDEMEARRTISDAVSYIRLKLKGGYMLLRRNIQYGFWRNLIGGSVIGLLICVINLVIFKFFDPQIPALWLSGCLAVAYLALLLSSKWAVGRLGKRYARTLYDEFMAL